MDENTNQSSTTPLGNERRDNPGQTNIAMSSDGESLTPTIPSWTDDTSLEDITKQYTDIGGKYTDMVENAADNVGDRQVQLIGNDFGATNPYMYNTYYEPAATDFASEMRVQGTQKAVEVGLDRAQSEAESNAAAAQTRYNNAVSAYKAKQEQQAKSKVNVSETDLSKLPDGATEQEILNYYKTGEMSEDDIRNKYTSEGIKQIQEKSSEINWDDASKRKPVSADTKAHFGITDEQWKNMSKDERDAFWGREDVGNYWTKQYMIKYFTETYGEAAGKGMANSFNTLNEQTDNFVKAIKSKDLSTLKNIDVDIAGVQVSPLNETQKLEAIKQAIRETDKLSEEEKNKYLDIIQSDRYYDGAKSEKAFIKLWNDIESKQLVHEDNSRAFGNEGPDYIWKYANTPGSVSEKTVDDVWEVMKLFAGSDDLANMSVADDKYGILSYVGLSSQDYSIRHSTNETLMSNANEKQLDNVMTRVFGIDVDSWNKIADLESERPEDYVFLRDHANFVLAGGAGAFEQVTDENKKYFINGEYWSASDEDSPISVGDLIFHTVDGTVDAEGKYTDPNLEEFLDDYNKIYTGKLEATDENIKKLETNYNKYANRVARAMFLSGNYGTSIDEDLYNVILALDGVSDSNLTISNPNNPEEKISVADLSSWFNSLSDDSKYNAYIALSNKARQSRGVMILRDDDTGQLYDAGLTQNGKNTIGKYGEKSDSSSMNAANKINNLSNETCLAMVFYLDNEIKNGNIDTGFLTHEGVDLSDAFFNSIYNNLVGAGEFFLSVGALGAGSVGLLFGAENEKGTNDLLDFGVNMFNEMSTMNEADDLLAGSGRAAMNSYTQQMREMQRSNLNHMVDTTFNLDYFNVENTVDPNTGEVKDSDGNVLSIDNTNYNHVDQGKAFLTGAAGMAGAITEFVLEAALTAGVGKIAKIAAKGTSSALRKAARAVASKSSTAAAVYRATSKFVKTTARWLTTPVTKSAVLSALQATHAANYIDDAARQFGDDAVKGVMDGTIKNADEFAEFVGKTTSAAEAAKSAADDTARNILKEGEKKAAEAVKNYSDDVAEAVVKGESMVDDIARGAAESSDDISRTLTKEEAKKIFDSIKDAQKKLQSDYAIRYALDAVADNADNVASNFAQRLLNKIEGGINSTQIFKNVNNSIRSVLKDGLAEAASRAAVNGRLAAATGTAISKIANLSDDAAAVLYGMLRAAESSADNVAQYAFRGVSRAQAAVADVVLKNIDFKKAAQKIIEANERVAIKGAQLGLDDVFRIIATEGATDPGNLLKVLKLSDFVKDRIKDWSRDIAQNYWSPELDEHFESHYVDFNTYIHSPEQWLLSAGFDLGVTGANKLINRAKLHFIDSKIDDILGGIDLSTANKADRAKLRQQMVQLDNLRSKASKLNNKILDGKISFNRVHDVADKAERAVKDRINVMTDYLDISKTSELIQNTSSDALSEANAALSKGGFKSKRKYKQILADADQFNRMLVRGNSKLSAVQEISQALQQVSITRYLDINTHSKTIHKLTGEQWGKVMSVAWKDITDANFAAEYGDELGINGKAFASKHTINFKDPAKTKAAYAAGQTLVYNNIYKSVRKVMGNSLTKSEYVDLRIELNSIRDRMIAAGNQIIDDGKKVRWNYMPTQALTWESEPGTMSAVRALWGWDYKGGVHMTQAGEIANPLIARDKWDFSSIIDDFDNGKNTFKRKKGAREIEIEYTKTPGAVVDEYKDVNYNWSGFDPAYACNAYLNSIDSARIVQPLLDPINGVAIKNPTLARKALHTSNITLDNELAAIRNKYNKRVDDAIAKTKAAKGKRTSKTSVSQRASIIKDLSGSDGCIKEVVKKDAGKKIAKIETKIDKATAKIKKEIYDSPAVSAVETLYSNTLVENRVAPDARKSLVVSKMQSAYEELGEDIAAVRDMYTKKGSIKKEYLDTNGEVKSQYVDVEGNIIPTSSTSETYNNTYATQYRTFVNQLAKNKSLKADAFASNNARIIALDDGVKINANVFNKTIYDVIATKMALDLGVQELNIDGSSISVAKSASGKLSPDEMVMASINKRLQPVDLDSDNARYTLTKEARTILGSLYGDWSNYKQKSAIEKGSAKDKFFQNALSNAFDEAESSGGQINTYDFVQLVDKHIPDFVKDAGKNTKGNVDDFFGALTSLRSYENSGGTAEMLLGDLHDALETEKAKGNPDGAKIKALSNTIDAISGSQDYNLRTINRANFAESLDYEIGEKDAGSDVSLTKGDVTADESASVQLDGLANTWVPKGVDEDLIGSVNNDSASDLSLKGQTPTKLDRESTAATKFNSNSIGTEIKTALDILGANKDSSYGARITLRETKRNAFDSLKKEFDTIADRLDGAANGKQIYRGNDILLGASDNQYLAFANGAHTTPWSKKLSEQYAGGVDDYTARLALIAGRDRSGNRSFGNIDFWTPEKIDEFIKKNSIEVDKDLKKQIDDYRLLYAEKASVIKNTATLGTISDYTVSLQNSVPEFLASFNSGEKSSFDLNQRSKHKSKSLDYHSQEEWYASDNPLVKKELDKAKKELSRPVNDRYADSLYGGLDDADTLYDWDNSNTAKKVQLEIVQEALDTDEEYQNLLMWRAGEKEKNKIAEIDKLISSREKEVAGNIDRTMAQKTLDKIADREGFDNAYLDDDGNVVLPSSGNTRNPEEMSSSDAYEYDHGDMPSATGDAQGHYNLPYINFLNATKKYNISEALANLNNSFYGNGGSDGYIDTRAKLNATIADEMGAINDTINSNIVDKITALKELDGASDGEVADILKKAKVEADNIEDKTVREYVIKRLDDEIKFAEENLELSDKVKDNIAKRLAEHDPEYKAALEAKRLSDKKPTGAEVSVAIPNGTNPVFINGDIAPDGCVTLQQLLDARKTLELSRSKSGKNTFKSSVETKKVLNSMRKEVEYGSSSLTTKATAERQDTWILNLYKRIYDSTGEALPKVPSFDDISRGYMEYKGKKINLDLKLDEVYLDPKIASLGHAYWGEGTSGAIERFYKAAESVSAFNKSIQDIQLAGGLGQYNAFTLRNAITMMWQDPVGGTRALFSNFHNARSNESVVQFYLNNHEKLLKMAIDSGDYSALNAFTSVINARDEITGGGAISEAGHAMMDMPDNIKKEGAIMGLWRTTSNTYNAIFSNPTFVRWAAVAKADMQLRNYDHATKFVNRIVARYGLTDEDFANMEGGMGSKDRYIAHLAQMRTDRYWTPSKFISSGGNADKYLVRQKDAALKRTMESLRGMPQKKTLRQCLSDFFFAIGYKLQMNAHPVMGIGSIFTALPNNLRASNSIRNRTSFSMMTSRFAGRGDRNEALVMIGIAALAHAWNTYIGAPSAFEELYNNVEENIKGDSAENGTYGIAQSLLNFQDFGKFWLPNTKDGTFDSTQRGVSIDPFFSVFTLQNSATRAVNKFLAPNQIPINTQRTFYQEDNQNIINRIQGVSDELIGANLLSGYKALYEVLNNSTYFGNNIWERKRLPDGSENPNYNPLRNVMASVAHILNLEEAMLGDSTNRWVKGLDIDTQTWKDGEQVDPYSVGPEIGNAGEYNGKTGTVSGSGIIQHEYVSALAKANDGEYFDALTESMELPFKTRNYASRARTQLNTVVIAALRNAKKDYDNKVANASADEKDNIYADFAKKAVNIMHNWSAKNAYALGENDELTASATKILVSFMADEYDDVTNRVQNRYDKLRQELKMADGDQFLFSKEAMESAIVDGMSDEEAAELHNKHLTALKEAQIKEYEAREALVNAGLDPSLFDTADYINADSSAKSATFDKKTYREILGQLESSVGEFKNYSEMKSYYEAQIAEATTTERKAKLANTYNEYVLGVISPYIEAGYGAAAFNNIYWDGDNICNKLGQYIILPADQYYGGKYPRTNYLKDMLGIGYRDSSNLPTDKQVNEQLSKVAKALANGQISSASALVDNALVQLRKGYWHAAPVDYNKLIRMRALLSSRSK